MHAPAYASFSGASKSEMLDLYELLDISELGVAMQCAAPMEVDRPVELCLDLAESSGQIFASARVIWSDSAGRVGLSFPLWPIPPRAACASGSSSTQWLGAANAVISSGGRRAKSRYRPAPGLNTDTLTAASAVQREAESLGSDLEAVLSLVDNPVPAPVLHASGAAIALAGKDPETMICRASVGQSAPPVGLCLQVGSGFSGGMSAQPESRFAAMTRKRTSAWIAKFVALSAFAPCSRLR